MFVIRLKSDDLLMILHLKVFESIFLRVNFFLHWNFKMDSLEICSESQT